MKITIIQPFIADYREDFYIKLLKLIDLDIFCIEKPSKQDAFNESSSIDVNWLNTFQFQGYKFFNFLNKKY